VAQEVPYEKNESIHFSFTYGSDPDLSFPGIKLSGEGIRFGTRRDGKLEKR